MCNTRKRVLEVSHSSSSSLSNSFRNGKQKGNKNNDDNEDDESNDDTHSFYNIRGLKQKLFGGNDTRTIMITIGIFGMVLFVMYRIITEYILVLF